MSHTLTYQWRSAGRSSGRMMKKQWNGYQGAMGCPSLRQNHVFYRSSNLRNSRYDFPGQFFLHTPSLHISTLLYAAAWLSVFPVGRWFEGEDLPSASKTVRQGTQWECPAAGLGWNLVKCKQMYPLVNKQKATENHHFAWVNKLFLWPFSLANC